MAAGKAADSSSPTSFSIFLTSSMFVGWSDPVLLTDWLTCRNNHPRVIGCDNLRRTHDFVQSSGAEVRGVSHFCLSVTGTLNGACWTVYGLLRFDPNLVAPNGLGFFFGLLPLGVYAWYYKGTPGDDDDEKPAKSEVQLLGNIV